MSWWRWKRFFRDSGLTLIFRFDCSSHDAGVDGVLAYGWFSRWLFPDCCTDALVTWEKTYSWRLADAGWTRKLTLVCGFGAVLMIWKLTFYRCEVDERISYEITVCWFNSDALLMPELNVCWVFRWCLGDVGEGLLVIQGDADVAVWVPSFMTRKLTVFGFMVEAKLIYKKSILWFFR